MRFVSIVGTQAMAVLNPLLSFVNDGRVVTDDVVLMATKETVVIAERLQDYLQCHAGLVNVPVLIERVVASDNTESKPTAWNMLHGLAVERPVCFNAAGGMNYQVARCIARLKPGRDVIVYPGSDKIHLWGFSADGGFFLRDLPLPGNLEFIKIMELQGLEMIADPALSKLYVDQIPKKYRDKLPSPDAVGIRIGSVGFDAVWNRRNKLRLLKIFAIEQKGGKKDRERQLAKARELINLAMSRERFGELYDREIVVFCPGYLETDIERLRTEAGAKISTVAWSPDMKGLAAGELKRILDGVQRGNEIDHENASRKTHAVADRTPRPGTLAVVLGPNLMPTLQAIWSHRPGRLILLYTPGNEVVEKYLAAVVDNAALLPPEVGRIESVPVSITGMEVFGLKPPADGSMVVNVTPGTKGQTVCLSWWARTHDALLYSIRTDLSAVVPLDGAAEELPLCGPSPADYLRLSGVELESPGNTRKVLETQKNRHLYGFFREILASGKSVRTLLVNREAVVAGTYRGELTGAENNLRFVLRGRSGKELVIPWQKGMWFEQLVGYALLSCGADDVQTQIKTAWSRKTRKKIQESYAQGSHKTDIDVAARFGGDFIAVSCKARVTIEKTTKDAEEIAAVARNFGRFCLPFLCQLVHDGEPDPTEGGVVRFGWRTLFDPEALRTMIKDELRRKRKVHQRDQQDD